MTSPSRMLPTMSDADPVTFEELACANGLRVGVITLNRPRQLNALNLVMCERMLAMLRTWASDTGLALVMLQGAGDRGFCAGGDVAVSAASSMATPSSMSSTSSTSFCTPTRSRSSPGLMACAWAGAWAS